MPLKLEVKKALKSLGFSDYNIIIYETLLREKELDARQLSQKAKVPYSRVYEILNDMIEKRYIIKLDGRPSTYKPCSPIDVLKEIQKRRDQEFEQNSKIVKDTLMNIFTEKRSAATANVAITFGMSTNTTRMLNVIKNAVRSISMIIRDEAVFIPKIMGELSLLKLKHVKAKILLSSSSKSKAYIEEISRVAEIKYLDDPPITLLIGDEQNVLIIAAGDYLKKVSDDLVGMSISNSPSAFVINSLFQNLWKAGKPK
ncbi:MAG: TrmB family transcriptional regulator [Promethearchaeota archaeon]